MIDDYKEDKIEEICYDSTNLNRFNINKKESNETEMD